MTDTEKKRLRARDLERRLRALGIDCPPGALEPLEDERLTRSPVATASDRPVAGGSLLAPQRIVRLGSGPSLGLR